MAYPPDFFENTGFYLPTTGVYDIQQIYSVDVNSEDFKLLLVNLYQNLNNMAMAVNARDNGYYVLDEVVDNQTWFTVLQQEINNPRVNYRIVVNFGALPAAGTKSVPHTIDMSLLTTPNFSWTKIYGTATNPTTLAGIPLPFVSAAGNNIQLDVDAVNVNVTVTADYSAYTICYLVLEYMKYQ